MQVNYWRQTFKIVTFVAIVALTGITFAAESPKIKGISDKELFSIQVDDPVSAVAFSPDGKFVLEGSGIPGERGQAHTWDAKTGKLVQKFAGQHKGHITSVAIAPDSKTVATASWDGSVKLWEMESGKCRTTWRLEPTYVEAVAFSHDGKSIAAGTYDFNFKQAPYIQVWDTATEKPTLTLKGFRYFFQSLMFTDKSLLGSDSGLLIQWNAMTGKEEKVITSEALGDTMFRCCLAADESTLAVHVYNKGILLFDIKAEKRLGTIPANLNANSPMIFTSDGKNLGVGEKTGIVKIWDVSTKKEIASLKAHSEAVSGLAFSPNGGLMVTSAANGDKGILRIWKCRQE